MESSLGKGRKPRYTHSRACRRPNVALPAIPLMNNMPIRICPAVGAESADGAVVGMTVMKQPAPTAIEASHFANSHNLCHPFISNSYVVCLSKRSQVVCRCNVRAMYCFKALLKNLLKTSVNPPETPCKPRLLGKFTARHLLWHACSPDSTGPPAFMCVAKSVPRSRKQFLMRK